MTNRKKLLLALSAPGLVIYTILCIFLYRWMGTDPAESFFLCFAMVVAPMIAGIVITYPD